MQRVPLRISNLANLGDLSEKALEMAAFRTCHIAVNAWSDVPDVPKSCLALGFGCHHWPPASSMVLRSRADLGGCGTRDGEKGSDSANWWDICCKRDRERERERKKERKREG